jgi:hypothetical protein
MHRALMLVSAYHLKQFAVISLVAQEALLRCPLNLSAAALTIRFLRSLLKQEHTMRTVLKFCGKCKLKWLFGRLKLNNSASKTKISCRGPSKRLAISSTGLVVSHKISKLCLANKNTLNKFRKAA